MNRQIRVDLITDAVAKACVTACLDLPHDVLDALRKARQTEDSPAGLQVLDELIQNAEIARTDRVPICQDTGLTLVFVELGQHVTITGGDLYDAINAGVRKAYDEAYLRKSIVRHPLDRLNTGDNTPAVVHVELVPGDRIKIIVAPKGGGSENMSVARVLKPSDGIEGVKQFIIDTVRERGANACPPLIVGVGLGGALEKAALLSKKAILRQVDQPSTNAIDAQLERDLLEAINATGIGPAGLGGRTTALAVHVESHPCHIASLPVAITLQCHAARHAQAEI